MQEILQNRGRLIAPEAGAFFDYEIDGKRVTTASGKLPKAGRTTTKTFATAAEADRDLSDKLYKKLHEGFQQFAAQSPGPLQWQAALNKAYTGFTSLAVDTERGRLAAACHTGDGGPLCEIRLFEIATGKRTDIPLKMFDVSRLQFFENRLVLQSDDRILRLDPKTGKTEVLAKGGLFPHLGFALQAGRLFCSRDDSGRPAIEVLDLTNDKILLSLDTDAPRDEVDHRVHYCAALTPQGDRAAICRRLGEIEVFDLPSGRRQSLPIGNLCAAQLEFHPSGRQLAWREHYGAWRLRLFDLAKGKEDDRLSKLPLPNGKSRKEASCFHFAFSPNGRTLAVRDLATVCFYDWKSLELQTRIQLRHVVKATGDSGCRFVFGDNHSLATRTDRGVVSVYDLEAAIDSA